MAASGLVDLTDAAAIEKGINIRVPLVRLIPMKAIFPQTLEKNGVRNGSDIAKCLEKLNSLIPPKDNTDTYDKNKSQTKNLGYFSREIFPNRLGRSPSSDSIGVSNFSSDQGSVDSCQYSSNGSDINSVSSPSSPEEPELCSRAGSPHSVPPSPPELNYHDQNDDAVSGMELDTTTTKTQKICPISRTVDCSTCGNCEPISFSNKIPQITCSSGTSSTGKVQEIIPKENYLYQSNNLVPNSNCGSFLSSVTECCVPLFAQISKSSVSDRCGVNNSLIDKKFATQPSTQSNLTSCNGTSQSNCSSPELQQCNWIDCETHIEGNSELLEHIRLQHVQIQMGKESYVCLWVGCKVYNKPSCSLSWLERHILRHGGNKPFKCIVDNCSQHFPTQAALQRHVNSHFDSGTNGSVRNGRYRDEMGIKSFKRKRHLKYKGRSASAKTEDFFDTNIMEQIRYKLIEVHSNQHTISTNNIDAITLQSEIIAIRTEKSGTVNALLHWIPENILPDSWVSEKSIVKYKKISLSSLPPDIRKSLEPLSKGAANIDFPRVKHRRK